MKKKARWSRSRQLTEDESKALDEIVNKTPGMTRYGNRARTAIMLPLDVAKQVSFLSDFNNKSVSEVITDILRRVEVSKPSGLTQEDKLKELVGNKSDEVVRLINELKKAVGEDAKLGISIVKNGG